MRRRRASVSPGETGDGVSPGKTLGDLAAEIEALKAAGVSAAALIAALKAENEALRAAAVSPGKTQALEAELEALRQENSTLKSAMEDGDGGGGELRTGSVVKPKPVAPPEPAKPKRGRQRSRAIPGAI